MSHVDLYVTFLFPSTLFFCLVETADMFEKFLIHTWHVFKLNFREIDSFSSDSN